MNKNQSNIFHYKMNYKKFSEVTRERNYDDEWDNDDTSTSYDFEGTITLAKNYGDFSFPFELVKNRVYYAVHVIYNTGDSFSKHHGGGLILIDLFEHKEHAVELINKIRNNAKSFDDSIDNNNFNYSINYTALDGSTRTITSSDWLGYFESIQECSFTEVVTTKLKNNLKAKL